MAPNKRSVPPEGDTVVVSFRAPQKLVELLDEIAQGDQRTRANFIVRTLTQAASLEPGIDVIERILPRLLEEHDRDPDSVQAESSRGEMRGARAMIAAFFGKRAIRWVNQQVRQKTKLPIPHVVPLDRDGNRYGIDSEADLV